MCIICFQCTKYTWYIEVRAKFSESECYLVCDNIFILGSSQSGQVEARHYFQVSYYSFPQNLVCIPVL
jgi:hypothetical protein